MAITTLIEIGIYLLAIYLFRYAWRLAPINLFIMLAAAVFGYLIEHTAVTTVPQPYYYPPGLINLPGTVPLSICLGWSIIFFTVMQTAKRANIDWRLQPLLAGFLALIIDFAEDPPYVAMKIWVWTPGDPNAWFGIPWSNYIGWFLIVVSFLFSIALLLRRWPAGEKLWRDALIAFVAIIPAFIVFMIGIKSFLWINTKLGVNEALLTFMVFGIAIIPVLRAIPTMSRNLPLNWAILATPIYSYFWAFIGLFSTGLYQQQQPLVIVIPLVVMLGMLGFLWPSIDTISSTNNQSQSTTGNRSMLKKLAKCWIPWVLLILFALYMLLAPSKGLIGPVTLPEDDAFLPEEEVQWWYWTGHLESEEGKKFGFEVVFFTFDSFLILKDQLIQAAVTDIDDNSFHFKEYVQLFSLPDQIPNGFNLSSGKDNKVTAVGGGGSDTLHSEVGDYVLDLQLEESKDPVLHYGGGPHPYRFGGYTYYYSRETMATTGTITIKGVPYKVTGNSWFDRQYGDLYQAIFQGWQWFAIELDDGRQIMLYDINGEENKMESYASVTDAAGATTNLGPDGFSITILDNWKSPNTGCTYPSGWKVTIGDEEWIVEPSVKDQELRAQHDFWLGPIYWEGASSVAKSDGANAGQAYVELNGYCKKIEL